MLLRVRILLSAVGALVVGSSTSAECVHQDPSLDGTACNLQGSSEGLDL